MKYIIALSFLFLIQYSISCQEEVGDSIIEPFRIERSYLSGLGIPQMKVAAHPNREYYQKRLYRGSELSVFILSSETARNEIDNFPIDEFVYYLNGRADIESGDGREINFYAGDYLFVPKGFSGNWTNNGGSELHLELSVISNERSDSSMIPPHNVPFLLDREILSGIGFEQSDSATQQKVLYSGLELDLLVIVERPGQREIIETRKEEFIHVLNGSVTIQAEEGQAHTFHSGDFFVLPRNFNGTWLAEGLKSLRLLKVLAK